MTIARLCWVLGVMVALVSGCPGPEAVTDAGTPGTDTGTPVDTGTPETDTGTPETDAGTPDVDGGTPTACAGARPSLSGITGTEGLIIARDGTIYYSQSRAVGRLVPGGTPEDDWAALPTAASTVWGIALDAANTNLYVGSPSAGTIYRIDASGSTPAVTPFLTGAGGPNGLTIGPDGALYFSNFSGGTVRRVPTTGPAVATTVTTMGTIAQANGIAFDDDGTLLVASYGAGELWRLTLAAGLETGRVRVAMGLGSPDGVAVDANGDFWVTNNGAGDLLYVRASDGMVTNVTSTTPSISAAASLDFGAGALDCEDIYVASGGTVFRYEMGTVLGRDVLWH